MRRTPLLFAAWPLLLFLSGCGLNPQTRHTVSPLVYHQEVQKAKAIRDESRAHSIAEAIVLGYGNDYNDTLPQYKNWQGSVKPYVSPQLAACPSDYSYSKAIAGKKLSQVKELGTAELLRAKASGPDGRVVVAYVDGHIERK